MTKEMNQKLNNYTIDENGTVRKIGYYECTSISVLAKNKTHATELLMKAYLKVSKFGCPRVYERNGAIAVTFHDGNKVMCHSYTPNGRRNDKGELIGCVSINHALNEKEALEKSSFDYFASREYADAV